MIPNNDKLLLLVNGEEDDISIFSKEELDILVNRKLIKIKNFNQFISLFVGEFRTPNKSYFSLPKNFEKTLHNVKLTEDILSEYRDKDLRDEEDNLLIKNDKFSVKNDGDIESEKYFFTKLKEFFLDFITYEFIYPKKKKQIHSYKPIKGGKIDILNTIKNIKRYGIGTTYKIKDSANTNDWNLDDIYYHTLNELCQKYGTKKDKIDIENMRKYLISEGYEIGMKPRNKDKTLKDDIDIIKDIKKCDIGIIHQPIKNTLLDYYRSKKIGEQYEINIFFTDGFEYIWEYMLKKILKDSDDFRKEITFTLPIKSTFLSNKLLDKEKPYREDTEKKYREDSKPDIFSNYNNKKFIGDAKYYKNYDSDFDKEMYLYNQLTDNKYPVVIFMPSDGNTKRYDRRYHGEFEIIVMLLSLQDVLSDSLKNDNKVLKRVQQLITKNTRRLSWYS